jgi:hypothetical protein
MTLARTNNHALRDLTVGTWYYLVVLSFGNTKSSEPTGAPAIKENEADVLVSFSFEFGSFKKRQQADHHHHHAQQN